MLILGKEKKIWQKEEKLPTEARKTKPPPLNSGSAWAIDTKDIITKDIITKKKYYYCLPKLS